MDDAALSHWLGAIRKNQQTVLVRIRRVLNAVMAALQALHSHEGAVKLVHKFPYMPKTETGRSKEFVKQILKMEELWLVFTLDEVATALDSMMVCVGLVLNLSIVEWLINRD